MRKEEGEEENIEQQGGTSSIWNTPPGSTAAAAVVSAGGEAGVTYRLKVKPMTGQIPYPPANKQDIEKGKVYNVKGIPKIWDSRQWRKVSEEITLIIELYLLGYYLGPYTYY